MEFDVTRIGGVPEGPLLSRVAGLVRQHFLARYLGYTLVEGGDLTVRDQSVYLKTLGGLERVDVVAHYEREVHSPSIAMKLPSGIPTPASEPRSPNATISMTSVTGGINGVKITWDECETEYNASKGVECYERLKKKYGGATTKPPSRA